MNVKCDVNGALSYENRAVRMYNSRANAIDPFTKQMHA